MLHESRNAEISMKVGTVLVPAQGTNQERVMEKAS